MTSQEIYTLSKELTDQEVNNILARWEVDSEISSIKTFISLTKLGDSRELAVATIIAKKYNSKDNVEEYRKAYCN